MKVYLVHHDYGIGGEVIDVYIDKEKAEKNSTK